ncbi:uncharacterized protein LOC119734526 [Patiria miniata]|uniref:Uncharacterized protein n=1 Tax=Patiria miniata TaxID=46514 RepID=A0A914AK43_PATMI|nr:uncharacterized protein LOC119734526 [Patiria miniata]
MATVRDTGTATTLVLLLIAMTQAAPTLQSHVADFQKVLPNRVLTSASLAPPPTEAKDRGEACFAQLTTEFIQEGRSMVDALQARLVLLEELAWTGSSQLQPHPTSSDDVEKRDNLSPTQRVMVRREIMRRLRERAPQPVELPIGMRFKKLLVDDTTVPEFQDLGVGAEKRTGGPEMSASRRAAIRAAIMRQLGQGRQPVELPGMRGGK